MNNAILWQSDFSRDRTHSSQNVGVFAENQIISVKFSVIYLFLEFLRHHARRREKLKKGEHEWKRLISRL